MRNRYLITLLIIIASILFFYKLGGMALTDPDETFYSEAGREMLLDNNWVTPLMFGKPQFEKPIFYYWLVMASYKLFGVNEFAARFPSAVFGVLGILGVYFLGRIFFSPLCGFLSGLIMATSVEHVILARASVTDMVLMVFILYTFFFFMKGWIKGQKLYYLVASILAALAVLTKGPIGLFIPASVIMIFVLKERSRDKIKKIPFVECIFLFSIIALPWYFLAIKMHKELFLNEFFGFHNITRFLEAEHKSGMSPFYYVPVILGGLAPWSLFFIFGISNFYKWKSGVTVKSYGAFFTAWFLVVFLFFSISQTKLVTYIFPLFPVLAIISGRFWEKFLEDASGAGVNIRLPYYLLLLVALIFGIGINIFVNVKYAEAVYPALIISLAFLACVTISFLFILKEKKIYAFMALVFSVIMTVLLSVNYLLPVIEKYESSKSVSAKIVELAKEDEALGGESDNRRGLAFYTGRRDITDIHLFSDANKFFSQEKRVWAVIKKKHYDTLKEEGGSFVSEPIFVEGKKIIATNKPLE